MAPRSLVPVEVTGSVLVDPEGGVWLGPGERLLDAALEFTTTHDS